MKWSFLLIIMKSSIHVKVPNKVHWHFQKSNNKKYNLVPITNVGNFSCPIIIETLNPLNLLLFTFQNLISIHQEKLIIKHGQKCFHISHFKFYAIFKKGFMEAFSRHHFSIIKIVGFDNFKCIPCSCVPHNNRLFQSMEGSVNGKCGKMCSITTKFGVGNKRTLYAYGISMWRLQFKKWKCKLPKNWDYGLGFSSSHFRNCAKNWLVTNCTSSHTLGQKMEREHTESKGLPQCEIIASTIPKNIIMFSHCVHKHHQCYVVLKRIT